MSTFLAVLITLTYPLTIWLAEGRIEPRVLAGVLLMAGLARLFSVPMSQATGWWVGATTVLVLLTVWGNVLLPLKLYPVIVNATLLGVFAYSLMVPPSAIERIARLRDPHLPEQAIGYTRRVTQVWCGFFSSTAPSPSIRRCTRRRRSGRSITAFSPTFLSGFYLPVNIAFAGASWSGSVADKLDLLSVLTVARPPRHTVGWRQGQGVSHEAFLGRVRAWRALLARISGQVFALYLDDSVEFAAALFGAWQAGKTICLPGDNLPGTCAHMRPSVDGYLGNFGAAWQPQAPADDAMDEVGVFHRLDPDFVGLVLYTSGSTGAAQAIPKKLSQIAAEVAALETQFGALVGGADIVATVSHQHIYGLLFKVLWPITAGRAVHAASFSFFEGLSSALAQRDSALVSSPAHLKRVQENSFLPPAVERLRVVFSSGGALALEVARECQRVLRRAPMEVYGSSETGGIAWRQQTNGPDEAWAAFPGVHWRIDPVDKVLEVSSAYLPNEDWFRTADRAVAGAHGGFLLRGRIDRIAKIEGKRISLSAIESLLMASPLVTAARIIVLEGSRQRVAAFIVPSEIGRQRLAELGRLDFSRSLRTILADSIEPVGLPRIWRYPDALPVNAQGKTTVAELGALLDREHNRPTQPRKRLLEKEPHQAIFELVAPRNLLYFNGHFPGRPILPGVVQIDWVIACGRQCFDLPPVFRGVHALKFQRLIRPETRLRLAIIHDPAKSCLSFQITSDLGRHATGRILFGAADV